MVVNFFHFGNLSIDIRLAGDSSNSKTGSDPVADLIDQYMPSIQQVMTCICFFVLHCTSTRRENQHIFLQPTFTSLDLRTNFQFISLGSED